MKTKWTRLVTLFLFLIASICLFLWIIIGGDIGQFGLNAFTEILGIIVTVLIVDQLIKRQEEARLLPQQAAAYEDVRLLTSRIVSFWSNTYKSCIPGQPPQTIEELLSKQSLESICNNLNLDSNPKVLPKRTWWEWFPQNLIEFRTQAETILERHNSILDPAAYAAVHKIATYIIRPEMIATSRQIDIQSGFPRSKILGSYWHLIGDYSGPTLTLVSWCQYKIQKLESSGLENLEKVVSQVEQWDPQASPPCMISQEELQKQIEAIKIFRENYKELPF